MILVAPMPNELAIAHEGRVVWHNDCMTVGERNTLIRQALADKQVDADGMPRLHQLAIISNMATTDYAKHHSMLPALRVASKAGTDHIHGDQRAASFSRRLGMLTQRRGAYCCVQCIEDDVRRWHFSWFRRTHHLVGVDWCSVHGCALSRVDEPFAFARVPHIWQEKNKLTTLKTVQTELPETGFLRRYVDIATALLLQSRPFEVEQVNGQLALRATDHGLRTSKTGRRPLISDRLRMQAPERWLSEHLPNWSAKTSNGFFQRIDALVATKGIAGVGEAYPMVMAALYDSAEDAVSDVENGLGKRPGSDYGRTGPKRSSSFWNGEVWATYLECRGIVSDMAERLQLDRTHLAEMLAAAGLPSLKGVDRSNAWKAFIRFGNGQSLTEAMSAEGVTIAELEPLLLVSSSRVFAAVRKISAASAKQGVRIPRANQPPIGEAVALEASHDARRHSMVLEAEATTEDLS